ncbi:MAG: recombinase family protein [Myxococcota bacterium]|nr:recombinase family protein [Myxococcota bacterium]
MQQQPLIKTGPVAIYARFSSQLQNERSIEDQIRRAREYITQNGGTADSAKVFADYAVSGSSLDRRGFEAMMESVDTGAIKVIVTEDMSRISRDIADSANLFKKLQFIGVPLIGIADGIDTSDRNAKLTFTMKSMVADLYIEDLRYKTLRGLEGRAHAGLATGNVAYGYYTVPIKNDRGEVTGNKIEIHEAEAKILIRIFRAHRDGASLTGIAHALNRDGIPSPRVGSRHTAFGWGQSTIRSMLRNERYVGVWRFKEKQWVKLPGTNKRRPRARPTDEQIVHHRPELRIVDAVLWAAVQERIAAVAKVYERGEREPGVVRCRSTFLLSGLLVCGRCGSPMSISAGSSAAYYRCQTNRTKGTCDNALSVREDITRLKVLGGIQDYMMSGDGIVKIRERLATELANYRERIENEITKRRFQIKATELKLRSLGHAIGDGMEPKTIKATMLELEAHKAHEEAELDSFIKASSAPRWQLPAVKEIEALATNLDTHLNTNPELGRAMLRRWLNDGLIKIDMTEDGEVIAAMDLMPGRIVIEVRAKVRNGKNPEVGSDLRANPLFSFSSGGRI